MTSLIGKTQKESYRAKELYYACGCKYLFDHQIILKDVCPEHERELITNNG
jgi:hypothetical protein